MTRVKLLVKCEFNKTKLQVFPNPFNVGYDSRNQFINVIEYAHRAQKRDKIKFDGAPVDVS